MSNHRTQTQSLNTCVGKTAWSAPLTLEHEDAEARGVEDLRQLGSHTAWVEICFPTPSLVFLRLGLIGSLLQKRSQFTAVLGHLWPTAHSEGFMFQWAQQS